MQIIGIANPEDISDSTVNHIPKSYPGYFGDTYKEIDKLWRFTYEIENLHLIGRNYMHKYNNQDHSMLSAMITVESIKYGRNSKQNIWVINTENSVTTKQKVTKTIAYVPPRNLD